jgi:hypothetical protein
LKLTIHTKEVRRRVPTEEDPRMEPHSSLRPRVAGEEDWRGEPLVGLCLWRKKMKVKKWFRGLKPLDTED